MNPGTFVKWGLIILAGWWLLNWLTNQYGYQPGDGGAGLLYGSGWAPPLAGPGPIRGWSLPWQRRGGSVNFGTSDGGWGLGGTVTW